MPHGLLRPSTTLWLLVFRAAAPTPPPFKGGRKAARDRWYGLDGKSDFDAFRRWWHRTGKDEFGGDDLRSREDAELAYRVWSGIEHSTTGA